MKKAYRWFRRHWKPIILAICFVIFAMMVKLLQKDKFGAFDSKVYDFIIQFKNNKVTTLMKFISFLCSFWFLMLLTVIIMLTCKKKKYVKTIYII